MANPNYKRNADVLSPSYAVEKELKPEKDLKDSDWFVVPKKVSVPPEFLYYAVDQKDLDGGQNHYRGLHFRDTPSRDQQTVFQIQRWLERDNHSSLPVGEWVVAERVLVAKGEFIGRTERVDVPIWQLGRSAFMLAVPPNQTGPRRKDTGIDVDFTLPGSDAVLIDFAGGAQQHERKIPREDRTESVRVDDKSGTEVLLVGSDGRVMARNSVSDAEDAERKKRLGDWRDRIREVRSGGQQAPGQGVPINPFAPPPGGGVPRGPGGKPQPGGGGGVG
jgi:hypothetical protein